MRILLLFMATVATVRPAQAEIRNPPTDEEVVRRADLIVVGHLRERSLRYLPGVDSNGTRTWEYTAVLEVIEVLHGEGKPGPLMVRFHYGTLPPKESYVAKGGDEQIDLSQAMGSLFFGNFDLVAPPREPLWLLRASGSREEYAIVDPESVQVPERRDYLMAYLAPDPEEAVRRHPDPKAGGDKRYLEQRQIERALELPDLAVRAMTLADLYARGAGWHFGREARDGLLALGPAAAPALRKVFDDPELAWRRADVIELWGGMGYRESVPWLLVLLEENNAFWQEQGLEDAAFSREQHQRYAEVLNAIVALGKLGDLQSVPAIQATREVWAARPGVRQILEQCDIALAGISP